ncbi:MAG: Y-family DNA polymerase [Bacteroidales bacterium]|jgi:DNA polymerase V
MVALIDCNNFFCSCERVFNPDLRNKPVVVLSNNDGCVIARSNEAKMLGIPMGAPAFKYEHLFEKHNIKVYSSNLTLYHDMSNRVMSILTQYSPKYEIYSIDECFLDLTGFNIDLVEYGQKIRKHIMRWTGIPVSIGIAPTKSLAKIANRIAKKFEVLNGVHCINTEELRIKALKWIPVEDVWGIGFKSAKKLNKIGINTGYDFTQMPESTVKALMTITGLNLQRDLKGIPTIEFEPPQDRKSISCTRTFDEKYFELDEIKERLVALSSIASKKLRDQNSLCNSIMVFIETSRFEGSGKYYANSEKINLPFPTNSTLEIINFAVNSLKKMYKKGYGYKRGGIVLYNFVSADNYQGSLFYKSNPSHKQLMSTIDKINYKYPNSVHSAAYEKKHKMKQEKLSKKFTTDLNDILEIDIE